MDSKKEIYLHAETLKEPKLITIEEEKTVEEILSKHNQINVEEEVLCFIEDGEEILDIKVTITELKHKTHLHCHRCRMVRTIVTYNGRNIEAEINPSTTGKKVKERALKEFGIPHNEWGDYVIRLGNASGEEIEDHQHIGSFVSFPNCAITLFLTRIVSIQG